MQLNIRILTIIILIIGLVTHSDRVFSQTEDKNTYEIGSLTVTGAKFSDENAIKTISGLRFWENNSCISHQATLR